MIKSIAQFMVLFAATLLVAQDGALAGPQLTWYGFAQYRLRGQIISNIMDTSSKDYTAKNYTNQIGYYLGTKVKVNDKVNMQFQLGNDWVSTEGVSVYTNNWANADDTSRITRGYIDTTAAGKLKKAAFGSKYPTKQGLYPYLHLAFAKLDLGFLNITAGIQPVASNGPMDLIERSVSVNEGRMPSYAGAALISWNVMTNNSMAGLKVAAPVLKGDFKLDASFFTSVTEARASNSDNVNLPAVMTLVDLPMSYKALTVTPQFVSIMNKRYVVATGKGDHELGFGLSLGYKLTEKVSLSGAFGMAGISNENTKALPATPDTMIAGMIAGVGTAVKLGPGVLTLELRYSTNENTERDSTASSYVFGDLKYGWDVNKNFGIMPRVRVFQTTFANIDNSKESAMESRPELILTGKF